MSDHGADRPDDSGDDTPQNPFAGTPFEALFNQLGFTQPGAGGSGGPAGFLPNGPSGTPAPDLNALMAQVQRMFQPHEGTVDASVTLDVARHTTAAAGPDPSTTPSQQAALADAVQLAEMWLDHATDLPRGATTSTAWSRAEWIEHTAGTWHTLSEPVAQHVVDAMSQAMPEEIRTMAGPLIGMLSQAGSAMFAQQLGRGLGELAGEVLSSTDIGLPLGPTGVAAVLPSNVEAFGEGLELTSTDVLLYVVLRECAHHRLFASAPWLKPALVAAIEEYGRGTKIDLEAVERRAAEFDPSRPQEIVDALQNGLFDPEPTPEQRQALDRLEHLLALVEGWVDEVVTQATHDRMPAATALAETMRRRRASGGPAEQTFASLVGLQLRPRRLRDAVNLWAAVRDRQGAEARDRFWQHPDVLPSPADLDDPLGFAEPSDDEGTDAFDAELRRLLDGDE
ncbi:zinc-dependent metalloprotease [Aeromicrobium sp. Leaf350]|uniref:zinc-dependent metalloprotease n=1 Tax=Aeromicrobium sp. Leaf350 TaxID=2876565 RepID=UPI001E3FC583|nr:zinc-dependent metalloprotease [Aeromicrobium sp. Leaf350]